MTAQLESIFKYRQLIATLTARDLKARYRGSVLGFVWSLANPLLLLAVYSFVFTRFFPKPELKSFWLFLFSGILPWSFFAGSVLESSDSIMANAGLVKKVMFPAEALPLVVVLSHMAHFALALPILLGASLFASIFDGAHLGWPTLLAPVVMILQAVFIAGIAMAVSSASVLFRDLKDLVANLMQLGFFLTPIIYRLDTIPSSMLRGLLRFNPMTPFIRAYQAFFYFGTMPDRLDLVLIVGYATASFILGSGVFNRLRDTLAEAI